MGWRQSRFFRVDYFAGRLGTSRNLFNSVTRRIFTTVGVDEQIEFVATDFDTPPTPSKLPVYRTFSRATSTKDLFVEILTAYAFDAPYENLDRDAGLIAHAVEACLRDIGALRFVSRVETVRSVFFGERGVSGGAHV